MKKCILTLNVLFLVLTAFGKEERFSQRINGADYNGGTSSLIIEDDKYFEIVNGTTAFGVESVSAFVKLGVEEGIVETAITTLFNIDMQITVTPYGNDGLADAPVICTLSVYYDPAASYND